MTKREFIETFVLNAAISTTRATNPIYVNDLMRYAEAAWAAIEKAAPQPEYRITYYTETYKSPYLWWRGR